MEKLPLKAHRALVNKTQEEIAEIVGVDRTTYSYWERYITYPSAPQLIRLARAFNCPLDALYFPENTN